MGADPDAGGNDVFRLGAGDKQNSIVVEYRQRHRLGQLVARAGKEAAQPAGQSGSAWSSRRRGS